MLGMSTLDSLTHEQRAWLLEDEARWRRASERSASPSFPSISATSAPCAVFRSCTATHSIAYSWRKQWRMTWCS
jgi:hypothetical protein